MDKNLEQKYVKANIFDTMAQGFVIMDTMNNPKFPLADIILDRNKFDSTSVLKEYRKVYNITRQEIFMPWHFQVELVDKEYVIQNTRPINYKTPFKDWEQYICICIVGNSNDDVYMPDIYKKIANICIKPFSRGATNHVRENIEYLTGKSFLKTQMDKNL